MQLLKKEKENTMENKSIFQGVATALVTPTTAQGVDYEALGRLLDWQVAEGVNGLVIAGTTGEGSTLSEEEKKSVISYSIEKVAGRVPVIAGTGSNNTEHCIEMSRWASAEGADGLLVVTPYYNKSTQAGLVKMYETIADAATAPLIVYNVPSRTGVSIAPETYARMADHGNISAIKEANGDISAIAETIRLLEGRMDVLSGNDDQTVAMMSLGAKGVISVLSNIMPKATAEMCSLALKGDFSAAASMQLKFLPLIHALFCEVNPIPVKAAMAAMGWCEDYVRLPLVNMTEGNKAKMLDLMREQNLIA